MTKAHLTLVTPSILNRTVMAKTMTVRHQNHRGVPMAPAVLPGGFRQTRWTSASVRCSRVRRSAFERSRRGRKRVEMLFAHLKRIFRLGRLRLRGPSGAQFEFTLAAIAQNLRRLAKLVVRPPPVTEACFA